MVLESFGLSRKCAVRSRLETRIMRQRTVVRESMAYAWRLEAHYAMKDQTDAYKLY